MNGTRVDFAPPSVLVDLGMALGHVVAAVHEKRDEYRRLLQPPRDTARGKPQVPLPRPRNPEGRRAARRDPG